MCRVKCALALWLFMASLYVVAQTNGSNSPYSRFGLGALSDASQGFNKGMAGVAMGFRQGNRINVQNPASYSAIDSLSLIFDVGISFQNVNFKSGGSRINAHNTSLDYINGGFRLCKNLGLGFGFVPFSNIGYDYSESEYLGEHFNSGAEMTYTNSYEGDGGLHEVFIGLGWKMFADLSIGVNAGYLWGDYSQYITQTFYEDGSSVSSSDGLRRQILASISSYKIDFGVQYPIRVTKSDVLTVGGTYTLGHALDNPAYYYNFLDDGDTTTVTLEKAFELPSAFGAGLCWEHNDQWRVGVDVTYQFWGSSKMAQVVDEELVSTSDNYSDRTRVAVGGEWRPDRFGVRYFQRVFYRIGAAYATPYYKVDGLDGPREYTVTAGFGLPVTKKTDSRSYINVSFQWVKSKPSSSSLITENYLRLCVGLTFNERWFMKWKIQ